MVLCTQTWTTQQQATPDQLKESFHWTVYADIDYAKTDKACSKLPEEHLDQKTEYNS